MSPFPKKTFLDAPSVCRFAYPADWDALVEKGGESCGFGPHERDDVGLWISLMPVSVDTARLQEELPRMMKEALQSSGAENLRRDITLHDHGMVADMVKEGQGGHYWIMAGGVVVLFASSQVPAAERDVWNPLLGHVMASLRITRADELFQRQLADDA